MQIYILFYEIETNDTHLKPARVAIANINIVLDDDLSQMRALYVRACETQQVKRNSCPSNVNLKYKLAIILL